MSEIVKLRTGVEVPESVMRTTMLSLLAMRDLGQAVALYELLQMARTPGHALFGNAGRELEAEGLVEGGRLHEVTRDIVLAALVGGDDDFPVLVDPITGVPTK